MPCTYQKVSSYLPKLITKRSSGTCSSQNVMRHLLWVKSSLCIMVEMYCCLYFWYWDVLLRHVYLYNWSMCLLCLMVEMYFRCIGLALGCYGIEMYLDTCVHSRIGTFDVCVLKMWICTFLMHIYLWYGDVLLWRICTSCTCSEEMYFVK